MKMILKIIGIYFIFIQISYAQVCPGPNSCTPACGSTCSYIECQSNTEQKDVEIVPVNMTTLFSPPATSCENEYFIKEKVNSLKYKVTHMWKDSCVSKIMLGPDCSIPTIIKDPVITSVTPTCDSIQVVWGAVATAVNYQVTLNSKAPISVASTSYTFTGLLENTSYTVSVKACDASGCSNNASQTVLTQDCAISAPVISSTIADCNKITVAWNNVPSAIKYRVSLNPGGTSEVTSLNYVFNGLLDGTSYTVSVQACNSSGQCSTPAVVLLKTSSIKIPPDPAWRRGYMAGSRVEVSVTVNPDICAPTQYFMFYFKKTAESWSSAVGHMFKSFDGKPLTGATLTTPYLGWDEVKAVSCNSKDQCSVGIIKQISKVPGTLF